MLKSKVFRKVLLIISTMVIIHSMAFYFLSVPFVKHSTCEMEMLSVKTNLENVFKIVNTYYLDIEAYKRSILETRKREIKNLTLMLENFIEQRYREIQKLGLDEADAKERLLDEIRQFRYGNQDYFFVSEYQSRFISHPEPELHRTDLSNFRDIRGKLVVPELVGMARSRGEGYTSYWWRRLGNKTHIKKLTYCRDYPKWEWVFGTGVYMDDIEKEVSIRREQAIEELRSLVKTIRIGKSGYLYIFNADKRMIIHPNKNIERMDFSNLKDPLTGRSLYDELIAAAHSEDNQLEYIWDKPSEPGNYVYKKVSRVKYHNGLGWYIGASVYKSELTENSDRMTNRIIIYALFMLFISSILGYIFVRSFVHPLNKLSDVVIRVRRGDLTAKTDIKKSDDEIGILASGFNEMVEQLKNTIDTLDKKVIERTKELNQKNDELNSSLIQLQNIVTSLNQSRKQNQFLNDFVMSLTLSMESNKIWDVALSDLMRMTDCQGAALLLAEENRLKIIHSKGFDPELFPTDGFQADQGLLAEASNAKSPLHIEFPENLQFTFNALAAGVNPEKISFFPLSLRNKGKGILVMARISSSESNVDEDTLFSASRSLSVVIDNIQMLQKFRQLAAFDELTAMYNRRFGWIRLKEEESRSLRKQESLSIAMIDIDHFKQVNDTYGHQAGDAVLKQLAQVLRKKTRAGDILIRYGGEEIIVVMPNTEKKDAIIVIERIRSECGNIPVSWNGENIRITFSAGIAQLSEDLSVREDIDNLISRADFRLYQAKKKGRNRIEAH